MNTLKTDRFVHSWFSKNPSDFMNDKNRKRLVDHLNDYPGCQFTVLYSSELLNEAGKESLKKFEQELAEIRKTSTKEYGTITFLDIDSKEFKAQLADDMEQTLFEIAKTELRQMNSGGNPAAASDIIRLLRPSYTRGIYTDLDAKIAKEIELTDGTKIPLKEGVITTESIFTFPIAGNRGTYICNDVIAVAATDDIDTILRAVTN